MAKHLLKNKKIVRKSSARYHARHRQNAPIGIKVLTRGSFADKVRSGGFFFVVEIFYPKVANLSSPFLQKTFFFLKNAAQTVKTLEKRNKW